MAFIFQNISHYSYVTEGQTTLVVKICDFEEREKEVEKERERKRKREREREGEREI